jgi:hypothetical protein
MKSSPEVLIYLQTVKNYLNTNKEAYDYFLKDVNVDFFYKHLQEISQKNYDKNGEAMLSMEQFELLRKTSIAIAISESETNDEDKIFFEVKNFGKVCLN